MSTSEPILVERGKQWGDPVYTHERIARVWSGILNFQVSAHDVALCMVALKLVRASVNPTEPDSYTDAKGYADIAMIIANPTHPKLQELRDAFEAS